MSLDVLRGDVCRLRLHGAERLAMDRGVPGLEEVFQDPLIVQALQGKGGHDRKEWVARLQAVSCFLLVPMARG